jgi:hypothetical protein
VKEARKSLVSWDGCWMKAVLGFYVFSITHIYGVVIVLYS